MHGKSASVDVTLTSTGGDKVDLVADFTCGTRAVRTARC